MATGFTLVIDCSDPDRLSRFWEAALGYVAAPPPDGAASWDEYWRDFGLSEEDLDIGQDRIAVAAHGRTLDEEAALGTDRHDHDARQRGGQLVDGVVLRKVRLHLLGDLVRGLGPDLDELLATLVVGDQTALVLRLHLGGLGLVALEDLELALDTLLDRPSASDWLLGRWQSTGRRAA